MKLILTVAVFSILLLGGAVFLLSKQHSSPSKIDNSSLLIHSDSHQTSTRPTPLTLVEFGDFQCPSCGAYYQPLKQLQTEFASNLNFVFRNFPLTSIHQNAYLAAQAAESAGTQGQFWQMHDLIFENQSAWSNSSKAEDLFIQYAQKLNLNLDKFKKDLSSSAIQEKINQDKRDGTTLEVNSTPTFFLNGEQINNPGNFDDFKVLIKAALLKYPAPSSSPSAAVHLHANFKMFIDGQSVDFTQSKYQSSPSHELNPNIHFHDGVGDLIHVHAPNISLQDLFTSLNMSLSDSQKSFKLYVNGQPNSQLEKYVPRDLDRILVTYGSVSQDQIQSLITSVADTACIYSEKCPERGKPPTENCVGGLGTDCQD